MAKKQQAAPSFRNRIKEYREVSPSELAPNPRNWREHPEEQLNALRDALGSVGWAVPVIAYETPDGLMLIDGHARLSEASATATIPAIILDVNDAEAAFLLATIDPMSAMAEANAVALEAVMRDVSTDSPAIMAMLSELAERSGVVETAVPDVEFKEFDESVADEVEYHECPECGHKFPK